jgi:hypothetical protein
MGYNSPALASAWARDDALGIHPVVVTPKGT